MGLVSLTEYSFPRLHTLEGSPKVDPIQLDGQLGVLEEPGVEGLSLPAK